MAAAAHPALPVSIDEYLHSVYEPDMDYVDGFLEDRNLGEMDHWRIQRAIHNALRPQEQANNFFLARQLRVQVAKTCFRVPDTCLLPADRLPARIVHEPPLLCIEVLSPEDRMPRMRPKVADYLRMGVPEVWVLDPERKLAIIFRPGAEVEQSQGTLQLGAITLDLAEVFGA